MVLSNLDFKIKIILCGLCSAVLTLLPSPVYAHERFIKHLLLQPVDTKFFLQGDGLLGIHADSLTIICRTSLFVLVLSLIWCHRNTIIRDHPKIAKMLPGRSYEWLVRLADFCCDRSYRNKFMAGGMRWATAFFIRSPALVLIFSATNDALVMPSYPLDAGTAIYFQMAQLFLAVLILTQTLLPMCGAVIIGIWLYMFRWGPMVALDALPLLAVAALYLSMPWASSTVHLAKISSSQHKILRRVLGFGFYTLGIVKLYDYNLIAAVADNFPSVLEDPLCTLMAYGLCQDNPRECWIISFALAEIMSGFFLMTGCFVRVWSTIMAFMLTKLLIVDFGWQEIPHIFPVAAVLVLIFSSRHSSDVDLWLRKIPRRSEVALTDSVLLSLGMVVMIVGPFFLLSFVERV